MTQSSGPPKPPKLTPGEPLWGSPTISSESAPAPAPSRKKRRPEPAPVSASAPAAPAPAARRGPVQFGPTPTVPSAPSSSVYGGGTGNAAGRKLPIGLLAGVGAACFVLGGIVGAAAVYFLS